MRRWLVLLLLSPISVAAEPVLVSGAGSSLQKNVQAEWTAEYNRKQNEFEITYESTGSGTGKRRLIAGETDFAGSDSMISEEQHEHYQMLPLLLAPIAIVYNLPGITELTLDRNTLTMIFAHELVMWDDDAIARLNYGITLPNLPIEVVCREDKSGTTEIFTAALHMMGWAHGITNRWSDLGLRATLKTKTGAQLEHMLSTPGTIGYTGYSPDLIEDGLPSATLHNKRDERTHPSSMSDVQRSIDESVFNLERLTADVTQLVDMDGYPIVGMSYAVYPKMPPRCRQATGAFNYIYWVLTDMVRSQEITLSNGLVPIPHSLMIRTLTKLGTVRCNGERSCDGCLIYASTGSAPGIYSRPVFQDKPWDYADTKGWYEYGTECGATRQSPVDIRNGTTTQHVWAKVWQPRRMGSSVAQLRRELQRMTLAVAHWGITLVASLPATSAHYTLQRIDMVSPAEHMLDGVRHAAELQLHFHRSDASSLLDKARYRRVAVALLVDIQPQASDTFLQAFIDAGADLLANPALDEMQIDVPIGLPHDLLGGEFFHYSGSDSTPPCAEVVEWVVTAAPRAASPQQVATLRTLTGSLTASNGEQGNARPVSPLLGRTVNRLRFFQTIS